MIDTFPTKPDLAVRREKVWGKLISEVARDRPVVVWEFGVADGYSTNWWLKRLPQKDLNWHGFDRFIGLPRDWRNYRAGDLSTGGVPPAIDDPRVRWYVGDVEDTLPKVDIRRDPTAQWVILFDLDLYEPTSLAWKRLQQHLRPGDLLYFDEAFDDDERRVLNESVVGNPEIEVSLVGCTPLALALRVELIRPETHRERIGRQGTATLYPISYPPVEVVPGGGGELALGLGGYEVDDRLRLHAHV